jgi:hypothetical protein
MNSIPASQLVSSIPSVLGAGGNPLSPNAVFVDTSGDTSIPVGTVKGFPDLTSVEDWYGPVSPQAVLAGFYFGGYIGTQSLPGKLYFAQFNSAAIPGYIRGGVVNLSLTQLQALSGTVTIVIDGVSHVSDAINLASATSFTNAAALITAGLAAGTPSTAAVCSYDSLRDAFVITSTTTGGASTVAYPTTDSLVTGLLLTAATGAILAPGAAAGVPAAIMNGIVAAQQNWVSFMTTTDPDAGGEPATIKLEFANWVSTQSPAGQERFVYVAWDSDLTPSTELPAAGSFGAAVAAAGYNGVHVVWDQTAGQKGAFICGTTASLNTDETNGRITYAYKSGAGLTADVTSAVVADNLIGNGYNFYGTYATANQEFTIYQPGSVSGSWNWLDEYIDQILLNADFQLAFLSYLASVKSNPYNNQGTASLHNVAQDPIDKYLNFGAIQAGVPLSASQAAQVNTAAGVKIDGVLSSVGYYLQILPASPQTRGQRGSPPMTFWYTDGGSVQKIQLASIDVQ